MLHCRFLPTKRGIQDWPWVCVCKISHDDLPQVFRGYCGKEEARYPVAADHMLRCPGCSPIFAVPICTQYLIFPNGHGQGLFAKIGTWNILLFGFHRRYSECLFAAGCNQAVVLWWEHDWVDRPGNPHGEAAGYYMPLIPPKQSFWEMYSDTLKPSNKKNCWVRDWQRLADEFWSFLTNDGVSKVLGAPLTLRLDRWRTWRERLIPSDISVTSAWSEPYPWADLDTHGASNKNGYRCLHTNQKQNPEICKYDCHLHLMRQKWFSTVSHPNSLAILAEVRFIGASLQLPNLCLVTEWPNGGTFHRSWVTMGYHGILRSWHGLQVYARRFLASSATRSQAMCVIFFLNKGGIAVDCYKDIYIYISSIQRSFAYRMNVHWLHHVVIVVPLVLLFPSSGANHHGSWSHLGAK